MQQTDKTQILPSLALYVQDLAASRAFYIDQLGFSDANTPLPSTVIEMIAFNQDHMLLVGPDAGDITAYLSTPHFFIRPGATLNFFCQDLDAQQAKWSSRGVSNIQEIQTPFGHRVLLVVDRDGNMLAFMAKLSSEEIIEVYARGPQLLQDALKDLSEQDLDLAKADDEWTIRKIVHHIADGDDLWIHAVKAALVHSGCHYRHDWYTPDNASAEILDYAGRAIEPALSLFRANHEHILQLLRHQPAKQENFIAFAWPGEEEQRWSVQDILYMQAVHAAEHCNEILEIRRLSQQ
jgi:uncharacterized damage-inducible protein DinB/predicted enzyme related to lactoylglutathione lyase